MDSLENLTHEKLRNRFRSQFDLVNYAIKLVENMIHTGRGPRVKTDLQNRALQIIAELEGNKDKLDDIIPLEQAGPNAEREVNNVPFASKEGDRKKKAREVL
jgi:DNA-directed RNA polymerase subunit omega